MLRRWWKEYRMTWPFVAIYVGVAFGFLYAILTGSHDSLEWLRLWHIDLVLFPLAGLVLGTSYFGSEFTHGTTGRLLSEPVDRRRIWNEKIGAACLVFVLVLIATIGAILFSGMKATQLSAHRLEGVRSAINGAMHGLDEAGGFRPERVWLTRISFLWFCLVGETLALLFGVAVGPLMSLWLRQTHVAFWAALVVCMIWYILEQALEAFLLLPLFGVGILNDATDTLQLYRLVLIYVPLCAAAYLLARRAFLRLEV